MSETHGRCQSPRQPAHRALLLKTGDILNQLGTFASLRIIIINIQYSNIHIDILYVKIGLQKNLLYLRVYIVGPFNEPSLIKAT